MRDEKTPLDDTGWQRIDLEDRDEVRDWATSFAVTDDQLIDAVRKVGIRASHVRDYIEKMRIR